MSCTFAEQDALVWPAKVLPQITERREEVGREVKENSKKPVYIVTLLCDVVTGKSILTSATATPDISYINNNEKGSTSQLDTGRGRFITARKQVKTHEECLAMGWAVVVLQHYYEGGWFAATTIHYAAMSFLTLSGNYKNLARWLCQLSEFKFDAKFCAGSKRQATDTL